MLGAFLVFQGLTGAVAQYRFWLLQATDPISYRAPAVGEAASPGTVLKTVRDQLPGFNAAHVMYPATNAPDTAVIVMGGRDPKGRDMSRLVTLDQYQGRVIQEGPATAGWVGLATTLHHWTIFGTAGRVFLTLLGVGVFVLAGLGLTLWWRTRRADGRVRGLLRIHRVAGAGVGVLLLIVSSTGTALNLFTWYEKSTAASVTTLNMKAAMAAGHQGHAAPAVDIDQALAAATAKIGRQHLTAFAPAGSHARDHWFAFTDPQLKRTDVLVSASSGAIVGVYPSGTTQGGGIRQWLFPIHSGYIIGPVGSIIMTAMGLSLVFWFISGIVIWRRGARRLAPNPTA